MTHSPPTVTHFSEVAIPSLVCPSYSGPLACRADARYADGAVNPAVGNYVAIVATSLDGADGELPVYKRAYGNWEDGGLVSSCWDGPACDAKGLKIGQIADGTSKTILYTESKEERYGAWFSSASTWIVATTGGVDPRESRGQIRTTPGFVDLAAGEPAMNWGSVRAYDDPKSNDLYLAPAANRWAGKRERVFGPSSEHDGLSHHAFFDGHAQAVNHDVDPSVYLRYVTRSDGDPAEEISQAERNSRELAEPMPASLGISRSGF